MSELHVKCHLKKGHLKACFYHFISGTSGSSCVIAALGNTWSHSVNTRLILQYLDSERRQVSALTVFSDCEGWRMRCTEQSEHLLKMLATLSVLGQHWLVGHKETSISACPNSSYNKVGRQVTHRKICKNWFPQSQHFSDICKWPRTTSLRVSNSLSLNDNFT